MKLPITHKQFDSFTYVSTRAENQIIIARFTLGQTNLILYDDYNFPLKCIEDDYYTSLCKKYEKKKYTLKQLFRDF